MQEAPIALSQGMGAEELLSRWVNSSNRQPCYNVDGTYKPKCCTCRHVVAITF